MPEAPAAIWIDPSDVDAALARLGLSRRPLLDAVAGGYLERASCTANDAPQIPGLVQWGRTLRVLREQLLATGWVRSDRGGYSTVVNDEGSIAIAVASGDDNTGYKDASPTTRSDKGPRTAAAVKENADQPYLPGLEPVPALVSDSERSTWLLLYCADSAELRCELSLPVEMDDDGRVLVWRERIILSAQPLDPAPEVPKPDFGPETDVDVKRRA